jgi:hypothetical protein
VPESDAPDWEIVSPITHALMKLGGHVVPLQLPATVTGDGVVGVRLQPGAAAISRAIASAAIVLRGDVAVIAQKS